MALVCVTSVRAAPGASTLAVLAAACWPRPVALIEADPSGGALAVRYRLGRTPGLAGLAAAVRRDAPPDALWAHSQMLPGDLPVVVAPESGEVTSRILRDAAPALAQWCRQLDGIDVIVDCGRLGVQDVNWPLVQFSDETLIVTRPRAEELYPVAHRFRSLHNEVRSAGLVLVGDRPHSPTEISTQLGITVHGVIADDPRAAGVLTFGGSSRGLRRSPLVRSVRTFVDELIDRMGLPLPGEPGGEYEALGSGRRPMGELPSGRRRRRPPVQLPAETPPPPAPTPMGTRSGPTPAIGAPSNPPPQVPPPPPQRRRQGPPPPPPGSPAGMPPSYANRTDRGDRSDRRDRMDRMDRSEPDPRRPFPTSTGPIPIVRDGRGLDDTDGWLPVTQAPAPGAIWPSTLVTGGHPVVDTGPHTVTPFPARTGHPSGPVPQVSPVHPAAPVSPVHSGPNRAVRAVPVGPTGPVSGELPPVGGPGGARVRSLWRGGQR